ncbi:MAG: inositol monophosphatase family protein [Bacteroidota bacterium]
MLELSRDVAVAAALRAGAFIRQHAGSITADQIRAKGTHDFVTVVDEGAERRILDTLRRAFPDDAFLAEESTSLEHAAAFDGRRWIIDPLDGTTNFTHGVPPYAVSIALQEGDRVTVAVIYEVTTGDLFTAVRGGGAELNGAPIRVSEAATLDDSLIGTGFPFRDFRYVDGYLATMRQFMQATRGLRRPGAAAIDLAWVACGRYDGFFESGLKPWDVAAGLLLVEEAGGQISALPGLDAPLVSGSVIASNGAIHDAMAALCRPLAEAYGPVAGA